MLSGESFVPLRTWLLADLVRRVTRGRHVLQEQAEEPEEEGRVACGDCRCGVGGRPTGGWCEACWVKVAAVPVGGGRARAGLEIEHSERSSRVAISRAGRRPPAHRAAIDNKICARAARRSGGKRMREVSAPRTR